MNRAALMISDTSSVRFDFAFIYEKPVLSLEIPVEEMPGFERDDLEEIWSDHAALEIGRVISRKELETRWNSM
jgi:CDP-glycerol glycerophosphotransferase (TagB/SpsB family)